MDVEIKNMPEMRVAAVHHVGAYHTIGKAFDKLGAIVRPLGLFEKHGTTMLALYHDDPGTTPEGKLQSDAGLTIAENDELPAGLTEARAPGGRYATTLHVGPYEKLPEVWPAFIEAIAAKGEEAAAGVSFEIYLNNPMDTPKEKLQTALYVPLA